MIKCMALLSCVAFSLYHPSMASSNLINLEAHCIKAFPHYGDGFSFAAVADVPYTLVCAQAPELRLFCRDNKLTLSSTTESKNLFTFSLDKDAHEDGNHCSIKSYENFLVASQNKNKCTLVRDTQKGNSLGLNLCFRESTHGEEEFLVYDVHSKSVSFVPKSKTNPENSVWILVPAYELDKALKTVDPSSQLLRMSKQDSISHTRLSLDQLLALYKIHEGTEELKIVDDGDCYYGVVSSMLFEKGLELFSGDQCILALSQLSGCRAKDILTGQEIPIDQRTQSIELASGRGVLIKPVSLEVTRTFGDIIIQLKKKGYIRNSDGSLLRLRTMLAHTNSLYTDFALMIDPQTLNIAVERTDSSPLINSGSAGFAATLAGKSLIRVAGKELYQSVDRISSAVERFGERIESSSNAIRSALIESSRNLGDSFEAAAGTLASSLDHATKVFETTARFVTRNLSNTALEMTQEMRQSVKILASSIKSSASDLSQALEIASYNIEQSSQNIKGAATEIKDGMKSAGTSFEHAFKDMSQALDGSSKNIAESVKTASENFVQGMEKLERAAKYLKNIKFAVELCNLV